jgi:SHS2 domain-containing protein
MKRYETFDHTADVGVRVFGRTYEEIFANAAFALFDLITDLTPVREELGFPIHLTAVDPEELLVRWLNELLYLSESRQVLLKSFSFSHLDEQSLTAVARGEVFDPSRHVRLLEIKAVTYHQIYIGKKKDTWEARVIFDV